MIVLGIVYILEVASSSREMSNASTERVGCAYLKGGMGLFSGRDAYAAVPSFSKASELAMVPSKSMNMCATDGSGG